MTDHLHPETTDPVATPRPPGAVDYFLSLLEKVVATYLEAFVSLLLVGTAIDVSTAEAAAIAAIPAALTVVANGLPVVPIGLPFWTDLALRIVRTYVAGFVGFLVAVPVFELEIGILTAAAVGALPAVLAVAKGALSSRIGAETPAALPAGRDLSALAA